MQTTSYRVWLLSALPLPSKLKLFVPSSFLHSPSFLYPLKPRYFGLWAYYLEEKSHHWQWKGLSREEQLLTFFLLGVLLVFWVPLMYFCSFFFPVFFDFFCCSPHLSPLMAWFCMWAIISQCLRCFQMLLNVLSFISTIKTLSMRTWCGHVHIFTQKCAIIKVLHSSG